MAVVMTTKFYEEDTPAWHDLSKVVFTSPNIDSPNIAGTRSHILPGQLDLGMWYEDASNMYRIEDKQELDTSTYFGYSAQIHDQFDMGDPPLYITIDQTDQENWIEYVRERVDEAGGSWPIQYKVVSGNWGYISFDGATFSGVNTPENMINDTGWVVLVEELPEEGFIYLPFQFYLTHCEFGCVSNNAIVSLFEIVENESGNAIFLIRDDHNNTMEVETFAVLPDKIGELYSDFYVKLLSAKVESVYASISNLKLQGYYLDDAYAFNSVTCSSGTDPINILNPVGWSVDELGTDAHWVTFEFDSPKRVTKVEFNNYEGYEIKDYKIQACTTISGTYVDLVSNRATFDHIEVQVATFSNYIGYNYYKLYIYSRYASSVGYGVKVLKLYEYVEDESITNSMILYIDNEKTINVSHANNAESTDYLFKLGVDSVNGAGIVVSGTNIYGWGQTDDYEGTVININSIVFEVTVGECYDCRLTAWDDVTHSTILNHLIATDRCRVSCLVYNANGTVTVPTENEGVSFIYPPVLNKIFKGNVVYEGTNYYYGDFDMRYRTGSVLGDYLMFKPMLYGIDDTVPYGIHDHVIVLHYSYT